MDLRFAPLTRDTKTCNADPKVDNLGVAAAKLVAPGAPDRSILALRPHATGAKRMPPLASTVVDLAGTKLLDDWIRGIAVCP